MKNAIIALFRFIAIPIAIEIFRKAPHMPQIACTCGEFLEANVWEAGATKSCPRCHGPVSVPSLAILRQLSGDRYPHFNNLQKILHTCRLREEPFNGVCHDCGSKPAEFAVPIDLSLLVERFIEADSPISFRGLSIGIKVSEGTEEWQTVRFPLLLCDVCHSRFIASYRRRTLLRWFLAVALCALVLLAFLIAMPLGIVGIGVVLFFAFRIASRWKGDLRLNSWLREIPYVRDLLAEEGEYRLRCRSSVRLADEM